MFYNMINFITIPCIVLKFHRSRWNLTHVVS
jgi:hypothetical protein